MFKCDLDNNSFKSIYSVQFKRGLNYIPFICCNKMKPCLRFYFCVHHIYCFNKIDACQGRYFNILYDWLSDVQVVFCEISCLVCFGACCSQSKILKFPQKTLRIVVKPILSDRKHSRHLSSHQKSTFSKKRTYGTRSSLKSYLFNSF